MSALLHRLTRTLPHVSRPLSNVRRLEHPHRLSRQPLSSTSVRFQHSYTISPLTPAQYTKLSDTALDNLLECLEELLDEGVDQGEGWEVSYSSGVLTLSLGPRGTYVINKQPPNAQIWLSSPFSGPKRYDYSLDHKTWFSNRDGSTLKGLLQEEVGQAVGKPVDIRLEKEGEEGS